jgi:hypothetical protein
LKEFPDHVELADDQLLGITTDMASSNYTISCKVQSTNEASGIEWPVFSNYLPRMVHVIPLILGAFMYCPGVKGHTMSWEGHERNMQFGLNESTDFANSQRL